MHMSGRAVPRRVLLALAGGAMILLLVVPVVDALRPSELPSAAAEKAKSVGPGGDHGAHGQGIAGNVTAGVEGAGAGHGMNATGGGHSHHHESGHAKGHGHEGAIAGGNGSNDAPNDDGSAASNDSTDGNSTDGNSTDDSSIDVDSAGSDNASAQDESVDQSNDASSGVETNAPGADSTSVPARGSHSTGDRLPSVPSISIPAHAHPDVVPALPADPGASAHAGPRPTQPAHVSGAAEDGEDASDAGHARSSTTGEGQEPETDTQYAPAHGVVAGLAGTCAVAVVLAARLRQQSGSRSS